MNVPHYLDVAATQIQSWIFRNSSLKGIRGASSMLVKHTSKIEWSDQLTRSSWAETGASWNASAGDVSGVVSLTLDEGDRAKPTATQVIAHLRSVLPGVNLQARWGTAATYSEFSDPTFPNATTVRSFPASLESPLARRCERCRQAPAVAELTENTQVRRVCVDCKLRAGNAGHGKLTPWALGPLSEETKRLCDSQDPKSPTDMRDLARMGRADAADASTRVCLIAADGNAVGEFLTQVKKSGGDAAAAARMLNRATVLAVASASAQRCQVAGYGPEGETGMAVIPHLVGGDDVLVSVGARFAWDFARSLLQAFDRELAEQWSSLSDNPARRLSPPTLSAALVFHHHSEPLAGCIDAAERALKQVKVQQRPGEAFLTRVDAMSDGLHRDVITGRSLRWLQQHADRTRSYASLSSSHRKTLVTQSRDKRADAKQRIRLVEATARKQGSLESFEAVWQSTDPPDSGERLPDEGYLDNVRWSLQMALDEGIDRGDSR